MNLRFAGQYFDEETGTHYNQQRDYAPGLGRYIQRDPIGLSGGINVYGYGYGNPLAYADPNGLVPIVLTPCVTSPQGAMACAAIMGATATAVANVCSNAVSAINDWMFSDGKETDKDKAGNAINGLTNGLNNEKDSKGRDTPGQYIKPGGSAKGDFDSLPGETSSNGQKNIAGRQCGRNSSVDNYWVGYIAYPSS